MNESSSHDPSSSSGSDTKGTPVGAGTQNAIATATSAENKAVNRSKVLMVFVLLAMAIGASIAVYQYTSNHENTQLEAKFEEYASQVIAVYNVNAEKILDIYETFSISITVAALGSGQEWPFVTVPAFEAQGERAMAQSGGRIMGLSHIVKPEQKVAWEDWTVANQDWMRESYAYQGHSDEEPLDIFPVITDLQSRTPLNETHQDLDHYVVTWQTAPAYRTAYSNLENSDWKTFSDVYPEMREVNNPVLSSVENLEAVDPEHTPPEEDWPNSFLVVPVYRNVEKERDVSSLVATLTSVLPWHKYFSGSLPEGVEGILLVISNTCDQTFSYEIRGSEVIYLGPGDFHDATFGTLNESTEFSPFRNEVKCPTRLTLYPTEKFRAKYYESRKPIEYTVGVLGMFLLTALVFFLYDCFVGKRQTKVAYTAERSTAIVSSLFPQSVAEQLMDVNQKESPKRTSVPKSQLTRVAQGWANSTRSSNDDYECEVGCSTRSQPIAELFPSASVFFADIVGFTAWSSEREPVQVFQLLEEIYSSFDRVAKRKKVFKVETIGDCYMAASGLPESRPDHALIMVRFARDCLRRMLHIVRRLEVRLGPGTGDLGMRIGVHSGPVTAGVLRGDKARFQLFGDTVNTAARMESTGVKNKIQLSAETAALLQGQDTEDWKVVPRMEKVTAKGKGDLQTYWLVTKLVDCSIRTCSSVDTHHSPLSISGRYDGNESDADSATEDLNYSERTKQDRTIEWSVDVLQNLLKRIVAMRGSKNRSTRLRSRQSFVTGSSIGLPIDEVKDIITLPSEERLYEIDPETVKLPVETIAQLRDFVRTIASLYCSSNPFHNFAHASHVTQSVTKLLSRVVTHNADFATPADGNPEEKLHAYTFGITSDPLTQFAVAFSALIHDVDHSGLPNSVLVNEQSAIAVFYKNKSVAEQNSIDMAMELLAEPQYSALRACIYTNKDEYQHFRQLVVNTVMATDIVDKDLGAARKKRWATAFSENSDDITANQVADANRKATIVIEHLIQASDVAHTMQHWHVYVRWNERFFCECYKGYIDGHIDQDPSQGWYEGELGFFDFYIIPLAKKLKECEVFGVASDEYLQYAEANRAEWQEKGQALVRQYLMRYKEHFLS